MTHFEEFKNFLPTYLSQGSISDLLGELQRFPENIDQRIYSRALQDQLSLLQGDVLDGLLVLSLPDPVPKPAPCMLVSNSCDMALVNERPLDPRGVYAPIIRLSKFRKLLESKRYSKESIEDAVNDIKRQRNLRIFFLPEGQGMAYDGLVLLDHLNNCPVKDICKGGIQEKRWISLSNYGFYLFLFKLAVHFTRIREAVERK